jgi:glycosyltransferase involved in cell wall biosynthesis
MEAISQLFDRTTLVVPVYDGEAPAGTRPLAGHNLIVDPLIPRSGRGRLIKLLLVTWLPRNLPRIWRAVCRADAVHIPTGTAVGTVGLLVALAQRRPLFVRHCGCWGGKQTLNQRFLHWLLLRIAGGRNVVLATGGGEEPPSPENENIRWIFATSMTEAEIETLPRRRPWQPEEPLRLLTVGRIEAGKNVDQVIRALSLVRARRPNATLDVVGDGSCLPALRQLATELDLSDAVTFHGKVDHDAVIDALADAHVFCFPTDSEGFPKAVHEALACGLPVVTTPVSVLPQLIGDRNGVLLPDIEPATIAEAILGLTADEERLAAMVRSAQRMARDYSLERWRDEIGQRLRAAWGPLREDGRPCF